jgi:beta-carotene hydroxylase
MSVEATEMEPIAARSEHALKREEAAIARTYMGRVPWEMVVWGLGNFVLWLSIWPLTFTGALPIWAAFALSTLSITICYLPSHEAQHSIIAAEGSRLRWLNELVGHVSIIPLLFPYRIAWITHKQHHAHTNDPELDPDYGNKGDTWWQSVWNGIQDRQFGANSGNKNTLKRSDDPNIGKAIREATILSLAHYGIMTALAWKGYAIEAALIWWLPRHIAMTYIQVFLSWAPHHPMEETGRDRDTRAWRSPVGTILSMGMEYHIVHHLFPRIPLFRTGPAYHEIRGLLDERGCRNDRPDRQSLAVRP